MGLYHDDYEEWCDHAEKTHYEGGVWACRSCGFTNAEKVKGGTGVVPRGFYTKRPISKTFPQDDTKTLKRSE